MKKRKEIPIQLNGIRPGLEKVNAIKNVWFGFDGGVETRWGLNEIIPPVPIIGDELSGYLHDGNVGDVYTPTVQFTIVSGTGVAPFTWSASGLPPGLTIDASTGVVSGTPTTAGTYPGIVITVTDVNGRTSSKVVSCIIGIGTMVGRVWEAHSSIAGVTRVTAFAEPVPGTIYVSTAGPGRIFKSTDAGLSWTVEPELNYPNNPDTIEDLMVVPYKFVGPTSKHAWPVENGLGEPDGYYVTALGRYNAGNDARLYALDSLDMAAGFVQVGDWWYLESGIRFWNLIQATAPKVNIAFPVGAKVTSVMASNARNYVNGYNAFLKTNVNPPLMSWDNPTIPVDPGIPTDFRFFESGQQTHGAVVKVSGDIHVMIAGARSAGTSILVYRHPTNFYGVATDFVGLESTVYSDLGATLYNVDMAKDSDNQVVFTNNTQFYRLDNTGQNPTAVETASVALETIYSVGDKVMVAGGANRIFWTDDSYDTVMEITVVGSVRRFFKTSTGRLLASMGSGTIMRSDG